MKILKTLQSILLKIDKKEAGKFREFAIYKKKKKLLQLFDVLYKHDKTVELEYLQFYLKEKNVHQNLRNSCKQLYRLILRFWNENPPESDKNIEISNLIHGATILAKRGLIQEGLELFNEANELAASGEKYNHQFEILRLTMYWTNMLSSKKAIQVLEEAEQEAEILKEKLYVNLMVNITGLKVHYSVKSYKSTFTEEDLLLFEKCENVATKLLELDECTLRSKIACHSVISHVHFATLEGKDELVEYHILEAIKIAESLYESDQKKFGAILISRLVSLLYLYFSLDASPKYPIYLEKFREYIHPYIDNDILWGYFHHEIELLDCLQNRHYKRAESKVIPDALNFIETFFEKNPMNRSWNLYAICFEIKFSMGKLEEAAWFLNQMNLPDNIASLPNLYKFANQVYSILYNYELKNYKFVENVSKSTRRLYSSHLEGNPGGKLLLSNMIKLSNALNQSERNSIFQSLQTEITSHFKESSFNKRIIGVYMLTDWINAKVHKAKSIQEYYLSNLVKE